MNVTTAIAWQDHADDPAGPIGRFRHPNYPGSDVHEVCGKSWHDHGVIDLGFEHITLCPDARLVYETGTPNLVGIERQEDQ